MASWREGREVKVDERLKDKVLMPGFIDNHVHPWLGALLLPTEIIAPEDWRLADGGVARAAGNRDEWWARLRAAVAAQRGAGELLASWGFHHGFHGRRPRRSELDEVCPQRPLIVWHRSFHEIFANTKALEFAGLTREAAAHPQIDWDEAVERHNLPLRMFTIPHASALGFRQSSRKPDPAENPGFARVLDIVEKLPGRDSRQMKNLKAVKLYADGAMFSQLMRMNAPGYIDGHEGEWMVTPEVLADGVRTFWDAGYRIHVHVNGDGGMDSVLAALDAALHAKPAFDHRFAFHHVGYCSSAQVRRMAALGAVASVNPYFIHALADSYSVLGFGRERASQIVRAGSMVRAGIPVSLHSDFMMAPTEPLFLAWCAANRITRSGAVAGPAECLTLEQALRGITIDAAHALGRDHEVGSIAAGKKADFTVLDQDPYDAGVQGLKDINVWGTVFEGEVFPVAQPSSTLHRASAHRAPPRGHPRYRSVLRACCGVGEDRCDTVHRLAGWASEALGR